MSSKILVRLLAVVLIAGSLNSARSQAVFAGRQQHSLPIAVGFGMSNFDLDWGWDRNGERRMGAITATLDAGLPGGSGLLRGFGLQLEGRDINYLRSVGYQNLRESTILGGSTYTWPYSRRFRPFAKYLWGIGSIDYPAPGKYAHKTNMVMALGGGLEIRLFGGLSARGDYEYQFWPQLFNGHALTPNGLTVSTLYDLRSLHRNR